MQHCTNAKILLVMGKTVRELEIMERLGDAFVSLNPRVEVRIWERFSLKHFIDEVIYFSPDIILTYPFVGLGLAKSFYIIKQKINCLLVCFRAEGFMVDDEAMAGIYGGRDVYGPNLVDYEIFWGQLMAEKVGYFLVKNQKLISRERIKVFGYPKYEYFNKTIPRKYNNLYSMMAFQKQISGFDRSKIIFFITGFAFSQYSDSDLHVAGDIDVKNELVFYQELREVLIKYRDQYIAGIKSAALMNKDLLFILKKHPVEIEIEKQKNIDMYEALKDIHNVIILSHELSTLEVLSMSGVILHYGSTVSAEAYLSNIPSVLLLAENEDARKYMANYCVTDVPGSNVQDVTKIPETIASYKRGEIVFCKDIEMEKLLYNYFNIKGDLSNYCPSLDIAGFLLHAGQPLMIDQQDSYYKEAILWYRPKLKSIYFDAGKAKIKKALSLLMQPIKGYLCKRKLEI